MARCMRANQVVVAIERELGAFMWAIAGKLPSRRRAAWRSFLRRGTTGWKRLSEEAAAPVWYNPRWALRVGCKKPAC